MSDLNSSICITSVKSTVLELFGMEKSKYNENPNPLVMALDKLISGTCDKAVIYNPDAVGLWIYQKYTEMFTKAAVRSNLAIPMLSVMLSVTPVCFASMYTGVLPEVHGITKYEKTVLKTETLFDRFIEAGKKCAIVSTEGDSISKIFLERDLDYFIYEDIEDVKKKALELLEHPDYDLVVIYNGDYDGFMHKYGPESPEALERLKMNVDYYSEIVDKIKETYKGHKTFYGFCPDHGCHLIDCGCGSHGCDMEEDMNVIHFYGFC